jgi:hypothetical protein
MFLLLHEFPLLLKVCQTFDLIRNLMSFIYDQPAIALIIQPRPLSVSEGRICTVRSTQSDIFTPWHHTISLRPGFIQWQPSAKSEGRKLIRCPVVVTKDPANGAARYTGLFKMILLVGTTTKCRQQLVRLRRDAAQSGRQNSRIQARPQRQAYRLTGYIIFLNKNLDFLQPRVNSPGPVQSRLFASFIAIFLLCLKTGMEKFVSVGENSVK